MPKTLPDRADIVQLRRQAKELLRAADVDPAARRRFADLAKPPSLSAAQLVIARDYGFASWPQLRHAVASVNEARGPRLSGPLFPSKLAGPSAVRGPADFLADAQAAGWTPGPLPDAIVFTFNGAYANLVANDERFERNWLLAPSNATMYTTVSEPRIGVTCLNPGATAMVGQVENQRALGGADRFVILGTAGSLTPAVPVGSVLVTSSAVRDDGISQHYLPPDLYVDADPRLTNAVIESLRGRDLDPVEGITWTIPAPYRATQDEIDQLVADGVGVMECETASLLAVAEALGVAATACLAVTGSVIDPDQTQSLMPAAPEQVFDAVLDALVTDLRR